MDPRPDPKPKATRWVWLTAAIGSVALVAIMAFLAVLCWRPMWVIHRAPATWALALSGLAPESGADDAAQAAAFRLDIDGDRDEDIAAAIHQGGPFSRRGAWRVVGGPTGPWRRASGPWRELLLPHLDGSDPVLRRDAREVYRRMLRDDAGVRWLHRRQRPDGGWEGAATPLAPGYVPDEVGVSALACLAFLGAGYDHRAPSAHKRAVAAAVARLVARQRGDGTFADDPRDDVLALMALAEARGMTGDPALDPPVEQGQHALARRMRSLRLADDALLVGLETMAMKSILCGARAADPEITAAIDGRRDALHRAWSTPDAARVPWAATTGAAVGVRDSAAVVGIGRIFVEATGPLVRDCAAEIATRVDPRAWSPFVSYLATLVVFQAGPPWWSAWSTPVREALLDAQRLGREDSEGSWDPPSGDERDRDAVTAARLLTLEIYHRHPPIALSAPAAP